MYRELNDRIKDNQEKREKIKLELHWHHCELSDEPAIRKSARIPLTKWRAPLLWSRAACFPLTHPLFGAAKGQALAALVSGCGARNLGASGCSCMKSSVWGTQGKRGTREEGPFWSCVYGEEEENKVGAEEMDTKGQATSAGVYSGDHGQTRTALRCWSLSRPQVHQARVRG